MRRHYHLVARQNPNNERVFNPYDLDLWRSQTFLGPFVRLEGSVTVACTREVYENISRQNVPVYPQQHLHDHLASNNPILQGSNLPLPHCSEV